MKKAIEGSANFPKGNWIHLFNNFNDIVAVLKIELLIATSFNYIIFKEKLLNELLQNLVYCHQKNNGEIKSILQWGDFARSSITTNIKENSTLKASYLKWLVIFTINLKQGIKNKYINEAIDSGYFLNYDKINKCYKKTNNLKYLEILSNEIDKYNSMLKMLNDGEFAKCKEELIKINSASQEFISIENFKIMLPLIIYDIVHNIINISQALLQSIKNDSDIEYNISIQPRNPFVDENKKLEDETITIEEIAEYMDRNMKKR